MGFVNKIMLMGNTTRDPDLRQLPSGTAVCDFAIATNRVYKTAAGEERQETLFVDCTAFGRLAEIVAEYCPKGRAIFLEGRLHYETWEDKNTNPPQRRSKLSVIAENVQFIGGRDASSLQSRQQESSLDAIPNKPRHDPSPAASAPLRRGTERQAPQHTPPATSPGKTRTPAAATSAGKSSTGKSVKPRVATAASASAISTDDFDHSAEESQQLENADLPF